MDLQDLVVVPNGFDTYGGEELLMRFLVRSSRSESSSNIARAL